MTDKTAELRELAQAARRIDQAEMTRYEHGGGRLVWEKDGQRELIADFYDKTYREFYAALNPSVVLALLERLSAPAVGKGIAECEWVGCGECDRDFACSEGRAACIRLPNNALATERKEKQ